MDGGANWIPLNTGVSNSLYVIAAPSRGNLWAVGDSGTIVRSSDGGSNWRRVYAPTSHDLFCADFISDARGWISGDYGVALLYRDAAAGIGETSGAADFLIVSNHPNPFAESTTLELRLESGRLRVETASLRIVDALGREVLDLSERFRGEIAAGRNRISMPLRAQRLPARGVLIVEAVVDGNRYTYPIMRIH